MKGKTANRPETYKKEGKRNEYPESIVGFPERNDASNPNEDMERVHVDLETLDISRKSAEELKQEVTEEKK